MAFEIRQATRTQAKARIGFVAPAGAGKTYGSLLLAKELANGGKVVMIDTENRSSEKYADLFAFDIVEFDPPYTPARYVEAIQYAERAGAAVIIIDSLSHAWAGQGGALEMVDGIKAKSRSNNSYVAWRDVTPAHNALIEGMLQTKCHLIACMRAKTEYVQEKDEHGKTTIRKVGMAPIQREGMDYEFDIVFDVDWDHRAIVTKSRMFALSDKVYRPLTSEVGREIHDWCNGGVAAVEKPVSQPRPAVKPDPANSNGKMTQAEFIKWAKETHKLTVGDIGPALVAGGFKGYDEGNLAGMQGAIKAYAEKQAVPA